MPEQAVCTVVAGPNGAGKTTFVMNWLSRFTGCRNFVNADLIAAGLSPLSPQSEQVKAGRLFLQEVRQHVARREDFAFETTLSGKAHLALIRKLLADGWRAELYYLWLPSADAAVERVAGRVACGGHDVPPEIIARRYSRGIANLLDHYAPLCSETICLDNSGRIPKVIFVRNGGLGVRNQKLYNELVERSRT